MKHAFKSIDVFKHHFSRRIQTLIKNCQKSFFIY